MEVSLAGKADMPSHKLRSFMLAMHDYGLGENVLVRYPKLSNSWMKFTTKGNHMDIEKQFKLADIKAGKKVDKDQKPTKAVYVAPKTRELPDDGILDYKVVSTVYDIGTLETGDVVQFDGETPDLMKCVLENTKLFGITPYYLAGLPGADYTPEFDAATWSLSRISYSSALEELSTEYKAAAAERARTATVHDVERSGYVRANGNVKEQTKFVIAEPVAAAGDGEDSDNEE